MKRINATIRCRALALVAGLAELSCAAGAHAQAIPESARPSTVEQRNRIIDMRPTVGGAPLVGAAKAEHGQVPGGITFNLERIQLEGATAIGEDEIKKVYASKIGTKISLADLYEIADGITALYRNKGYILTRATIPPQKAADGTFVIKVVEGFVNEVRLSGDVNNDPLIQRYAAKIREAKPLNNQTLERYLLLMQDLPGVEAKAVLQPAKDVVGATDVVLNISRRHVNASAGIDNRGSRYVGPIQANANLALNNPFGLNDQIQLRVANTLLYPSQMRFGEIRQSFPLGSEGTSVSFSASKALTAPGDSLKNLEIRGESSTLEAEVTHPLVRSRRANWFASGAFALRNSQLETLGTSLYKDRTRVFSVGTSYDFVDEGSAINRAELKLSKGVDWGTEAAGNAHSRANGTTDFFKQTAKLSRVQPLWGAFSAYGLLSAQYSAKPLLASEEFTLGGAEIGSAYDAAEISGDSGAAGRLELQYSGNAPTLFTGQYQLYSFYDLGTVWNRDVIAGSERSKESLSSAGLGARFNLSDNFAGGVEAAAPVTREVAARNNAGTDPRVFFHLSYQY